MRALVEGHYLPFIRVRAAESTLKDYRAALSAWDRFGQPQKPIDELYGADFNRFAELALSDGKSASTVDKWLRVYRAGCQFGLQEGLIDRLPVMRPVPVDEQVKWRPSLDELSRLYRACRVAKWPDRAGGPVLWWRAFLVLSYVGALRRSDCINRLRWDQVQADGIHGRRQKRKRLTFIPMLPCVQKHLDGLEREPGSAFILPCPGGARQFREAQNAIGQAAGIEWTPHAIKRAGTDGWFDADPSATAAHIISHARLSVTIRSYLDRVKVLKTHAPNLPIPEAFGKATETPAGKPKRDDAGEFLRMYRKLSAADREAVRSIAERLVS
jgi:hypothetical protein